MAITDQEAFDALGKNLVQSLYEIKQLVGTGTGGSFTEEQIAAINSGITAAILQDLIDAMPTDSQLAAMDSGITETILDNLINKKIILSSDDVLGLLPINRGGTNSGTADGALENLGAASKDHSHKMSEIFNGDGADTIIPISFGGTDASTAEEALINLGASPVNHTHLIADLDLGVVGIENGGTGNREGIAESARKLEHPVRINGEEFDGTRDIVISDDDKVRLRQIGGKTIFEHYSEKYVSSGEVCSTDVSGASKVVIYGAEQLLFVTGSGFTIRGFYLEDDNVTLSEFTIDSNYTYTGTCIDISSDGEYVAVSSQQQQPVVNTKVWRIDKDQKHLTEVPSAGWGSPGKVISWKKDTHDFVVSAVGMPYIRAGTIQDGIATVTTAVGPPLRSPSVLKFSPDGNYLACGMEPTSDREFSYTFYDTFESPYVEINTVSLPSLKDSSGVGLSSLTIEDVIWSHDNRYVIFVGCEYQNFIVFQRNSNNQFEYVEQRYVELNSKISAVEFSSAGEHVFVTSNDTPNSCLACYTFRDGQLEQKVQVEDVYSSIYAMDMSEDGSHIAIVTGASPQLHVFALSWEYNFEETELHVPSLNEYGIINDEFIPDNLKGKAPENHASPDSTYGIGNTGNYGHVKVSDSVEWDVKAVSGVAASPYAVKTTYEKAVEAHDALGGMKFYTDLSQLGITYGEETIESVTAALPANSRLVYDRPGNTGNTDIYPYQGTTGTVIVEKTNRTSGAVATWQYLPLTTNENLTAPLNGYCNHETGIWSGWRSSGGWMTMANTQLATQHTYNSIGECDHISEYIESMRPYSTVRLSINSSEFFEKGLVPAKIGVLEIMKLSVGRTVCRFYEFKEGLTPKSDIWIAQHAETWNTPWQNWVKLPNSEDIDERISSLEESIESIGTGEEFAPIDHSSSSNKYGQATSEVFGHVKLTPFYTNDYVTADGYAITPGAVRSLSDNVFGKINSWANYNSLAEIGLTPGTETMESIGSKLTSCSQLFVNVGTSNNASEYPLNRGLLHVQYLSNSRSVFTFTSYSEASNEKCMTWTGSYNGTYPSGSRFSGWEKITIADEVVPVDHSSTETIHGLGSGTKFGHLKLSNALNWQSSSTDQGTAATPYAVRITNDRIDKLEETKVNQSQIGSPAAMGDLSSIEKLDISDIMIGAFYSSFSPDGNYLVVLAPMGTTYLSPTMLMFKWDGDTYVKLDNFGEILSYPSYCSWSPDGKYLAVSSNTSSTDCVFIYKRDGDTFTKLDVPDMIQSASSRCCTFSPDGNYLVVGLSPSPYLVIYKRNGDLFTKIDNPEVMPPSNVLCCKFSPDGKHLIIGVPNERIMIYKYENGIFTKLTAPDVKPTGNVSACSFSPDGKYLAVRDIASSSMTMYAINGDTFTKLDDSITYTRDGIVDINFSPIGNYLYISYETSPYLVIYKWDGESLVDIMIEYPDPEPTLLQPGGQSCNFRPDGKYLAVGHYADANYNEIGVFVYELNYGDPVLGVAPLDIDGKIDQKYLPESFGNGGTDGKTKIIKTTFTLDPSAFGNSTRANVTLDESLTDCEDIIVSPQSTSTNFVSNSRTISKHGIICTAKNGAMAMFEATGGIPDVSVHFDIWGFK